MKNLPNLWLPKDTIGEIMITGSDKRTSQQCAQIYVDFMLDYPHEAKALQQRNLGKKKKMPKIGEVRNTPWIYVHQDAIINNKDDITF